MESFFDNSFEGLGKLVKVLIGNPLIAVDEVKLEDALVGRVVAVPLVSDELVSSSGLVVGMDEVLDKAKLSVIVTDSTRVESLLVVDTETTSVPEVGEMVPLSEGEESVLIPDDRELLPIPESRDPMVATVDWKGMLVLKGEKGVSMADDSVSLSVTIFDIALSKVVELIAVRVTVAEDFTVLVPRKFEDGKTTTVVVFLGPAALLPFTALGKPGIFWDETFWPAANVQKKVCK